MRQFSLVNSFNAPALIGVLILFCAPLSAQNAPNTSNRSARAPTYSVRGKVLDSEDRAQLEGVRVELRSFSGASVGTTFTRDAGDFQFLNVSEGAYDVIVEHGGYQTVTQRLDVHESIFGLSIELHPNLTTSTAISEPSSVSARELSIPRKAHDAMV